MSTRKVRAALTCWGPDGRGDVGGGEGGNTFVVLGVARLDGSQVAVTPRPEAPGEVQSLHGLRFNLAEDGLAHRLELPVDLCLAHLQQTQGLGGQTTAPAPAQQEPTRQPPTAPVLTTVLVRPAQAPGSSGNGSSVISTRREGRQPVPRCRWHSLDPRATLKGWPAALLCLRRCKTQPSPVSQLLPRPGALWGQSWFVDHLTPHILNSKEAGSCWGLS